MQDSGPVKVVNGALGYLQSKPYGGGVYVGVHFILGQYRKALRR